MLTEDESRVAYDVGDRYMVAPEIAFNNQLEDATANAPKVEDGFRYASNTNDDWLTTEQLRQMLTKL